MSAHNLLTQLQGIKAFGGYIYVWSIAAPTASAAGFAPGCIYVKVVEAGSSITYSNTGTAASATWSTFTVS